MPEVESMELIDVVLVVDECGKAPLVDCCEAYTEHVHCAGPGIARVLLWG